MFHALVGPVLNLLHNFNSLSPIDSGCFAAFVGDAAGAVGCSETVARTALLLRTGDDVTTVVVALATNSFEDEGEWV